MIGCFLIGLAKLVALFVGGVVLFISGVALLTWLEEKAPRKIQVAFTVLGVAFLISLVIQAAIELGGCQ